MTTRLNELGMPHSVVGGLAMFAHGARRFTEDVDLLVLRESMDEILMRLERLGHVQPAATLSKLNDTNIGIRIEFLIMSQFPGAVERQNPRHFVTLPMWVWKSEEFGF